MWTSLQSFWLLCKTVLSKWNRKTNLFLLNVLISNALTQRSSAATKRLAWFGLVYSKMRLADGLACIGTRFLLYGDVISNLVTPGTVADRDVHMWRHYVNSLASVWRIFVTDFILLRWRLEAFLAWGTLVQEPWETACVNGTFALGVQQSVQSYSDVTVLLALHGAGPIFALLDEIGRVSCSQTSHVFTWRTVPGYLCCWTSSLWRGQYNGMGRKNRKRKNASCGH